MPLGVACAEGHRAVAGLLLEKGADVDGRDDAGFHPLYLAAQNGHVECVKLLLKAGVSPNSHSH